MALSVIFFPLGLVPAPACSFPALMLASFANGMNPPNAAFSCFPNLTVRFRAT
jgi:hypothetical protein